MSNRRSALLLYAFNIYLAATVGVHCHASTKANALLRGAYDVREEISFGTFVVTFERRAPGREVQYQLTVEFLDDWYRFEAKEEGIVREASIIKDGQVLHYSPDAKAIDINTTASAKSVWSLVGFNPRVFGISEMTTAFVSLDQCFPQMGDSDARILKLELVGGRNLSVVEFARADFNYQFWIDKTDFRVHRVRIIWPDNTVEINSIFRTKSPLPSQVIAKRINTEGVVFDKLVRVEKADFTTPPPTDRFLVSSFNTPVNTMAIDYQTEKVVGYWDGNKIRPRPVPFRELERVEPVAASQAVSTSRIAFIAANAVALLAAVAWYFSYKRKSEAK
jgi:hypothetical protein